MENETPCFCDKCPQRFKCFTQEKVYTDPSYQALYETLIAAGDSHDDALSHIKTLIEVALVKEALKNAQPAYEPVCNRWGRKYEDVGGAYGGERPNR